MASTPGGSGGSTGPVHTSSTCDGPAPRTSAGSCSPRSDNVGCTQHAGAIVGDDIGGGSSTQWRATAGTRSGPSRSSTQR
jgi:hypothetical protein